MSFSGIVTRRAGLYLLVSTGNRGTWTGGSLVPNRVTVSFNLKEPMRLYGKHLKRLCGIRSRRVSRTFGCTLTAKAGFSVCAEHFCSEARGSDVSRGGLPLFRAFGFLGAGHGALHYVTAVWEEGDGSLLMPRGLWRTGSVLSAANT